MMPGDVGLLEEGAQGRLELPVGRLEELLRLIGGAASRQNKLVYHHLVPQFFHIHRHGCSRGSFIDKNCHLFF